jgi:hypothetical protein
MRKKTIVEKTTISNENHLPNSSSLYGFAKYLRKNRIIQE